MERIGIRFERLLEYECFESLQYWLAYDFEYEDLQDYFEEQKVIELEFEEDEDKIEDIAMLEAFLEKFDKQEIKYAIFVMNNEWELSELSNIA